MRDSAKAALELSKLIRPMLHGQGPEIQCAVLGDLVSILFAGHHPAAREQAFQEWIHLVRQLIPISEGEIIRNSIETGKVNPWEW